MLCINVNKLFQPFINYPFLVAIAKRCCEGQIPWLGQKNQAQSVGNHTPYFYFSGVSPTKNPINVET